MTESLIMSKAALAGGVAAIVLILALGYHTLVQDVDPNTAVSPAVVPSTAASEEAPGSLYGRVTTYDGVTYEGGLRWGGGEEAFWGHYFNGFKDENPWAAHAPPERLREERPAIEVFGIEIGRRERRHDLGRPFMARFGDIARIGARGDGVRGALANGIEFDPDVLVTLKSGTVFVLDRLAASDFDDGVRVWDGRHGVVDLEPSQIHTIEFLHTVRLGDPGSPDRSPGQAGSGASSDRLHGTVRTRQGAFTGFLQWDREEAVGRDALVGRTADGELRLRFDAIHSIARHSTNGSLVTLRDGREIVLSGTRKVGRGNRGVYVDDPRYGRVLVSWDAFERVDFSAGAGGPAYDDFPPGRPLTGSVTTRTGRRLAGRLVYDLDESETTETLDAPSRGVDYTLPFGLVASIALPGSEGHARVTLQSGEELRLLRTGDLGDGNAGLLVFVDGRERPEYVPWADVERVDLDPPPAMYPPVGGR